MGGYVRSSLIACAAIAACKFSPASSEQPPTDGPAPDAGQCSTLSTECADDKTLRACRVIGELPEDTACPWGCVATGTAHCGQLVPTGTAVTPEAVVDDVGLDPIMLDATNINTDDGTIAGVRSGSGVQAGIDWQLVGNYSVFRAKSWTIKNNSITVTGSHPLVLVATTDITIDSTLDLRGNCTTASNIGGPGGFPGGTNEGNGSGDGGGIGGGMEGTTGGGGGGHGGVGGDGGGSAASGGHAFGDSLLATLVGGGGGGAGGNGNSVPGGGGGGAVQLVANGTIKVAGRMGSNPGGAINASGCGGTHGDNDDSGGGGGAGGAILVEAHDLLLLGSLVVNGGGGGAGGVNSNGRSGEKGQSSRQRADGGSHDTNGDDTDGSGGDGAAGSATDGGSGESKTYSGGGGGGVGIMRFNSATGSATVEPNNLSPSFDDPGGHTTQGSAHVQ